jgi:hypothetical protein
VQRDDDKIPCSARCSNEWEKLRCRNRTHSGIFGSEAALNKTKAQGATFQVASCPQRKSGARPIFTADALSQRTLQH